MSEQKIHNAIVRWARDSTRLMVYPDLALLHHPANGGKRSRRQGATLKHMGLLAGIPDLHLPVARGMWHSLWLEIKEPGGRLTADQKLVHHLLAKAQNFVVTCTTEEQGTGTIEAYMEGRI
ncbi:MAG: hypothetical protein GY851_07300 [bacterium]|nr:hypothetical protein [bacterium]